MINYPGSLTFKQPIRSLTNADAIAFEANSVTTSCPRNSFRTSLLPCEANSVTTSSPRSSVSTSSEYSRRMAPPRILHAKAAQSSLNVSFCMQMCRVEETLRAAFACKILGGPFAVNCTAVPGSLSLATKRQGIRKTYERCHVLPSQRPVFPLHSRHIFST